MELIMIMFFSAKGLYLNFFRFEDHIIFPKFENLGYYENRIMENMKKYAPNIKNTLEFL